MYITYNSNTNKFIYTKSSSSAEKFCQTDQSLYAIDRKGCMFRSSINRIILSQECTKTNANIKLQDDNSYHKLVNGNECARTSDLSTNTEGSDLYFSSECNDSRLPFALNGSS